MESKTISLTELEAWAIDYNVRRGAAEGGAPWGEWNELLLLKVFSVIAELTGKENTLEAPIGLTEQELWAIESQVRHSYVEGKTPVGYNLLLKVQRALLALRDEKESLEPVEKLSAYKLPKGRKRRKEGGVRNAGQGKHR